jgi:hypothetical protein
LILLGLVIGAALTGIAVAVAESMDKNVRAAGGLPTLDDIPVLANIPVIKNTRDRRRGAIVFGSFVAAYSVAAAAAGAVIILALHR